jgi:hypothetical protein
MNKSVILKSYLTKIIYSNKKMSQKGKRPRKKPRALDRTTTKGKERAAKLRNDSRVGMKKWMTQVPKDPEKLPPLPESPPSAPLKSPDAPPEYGGPAGIDLTADSPVRKPIKVLDLTADSSKIRQGHKPEFLSSGISRRQRGSHKNHPVWKKAKAELEAARSAWTAWKVKQPWGKKDMMNITTDEHNLLEATPEYQKWNELTKKHYSLMEMESYQGVEEALREREADKAEEGIPEIPPAVSSEQATGDVFKNQLDDLALNERDTPYLSDRSAVETDDISDSFFDDKPERKPADSRLRYYKRGRKSGPRLRYTKHGFGRNSNVRRGVRPVTSFADLKSPNVNVRRGKRPVTSFADLKSHADLSSDTESSGATTVTDENTYEFDNSFFDVAALRYPWLKLSGQEIEAGAARERVIERRRGRTQKRRRGPAKRRIDRLARPNFSLQKLSQNRYILHAINVTKGVVSQVRSLLLKVPGMSLTVNGRMIAKKDALREIIRELIQKSRVEIVL